MKSLPANFPSLTAYTRLLGRGIILATPFFSPWTPILAKAKSTYTCDACGSRHLKWQGQCPDCGAWNSLAETVTTGLRTQRGHVASPASLVDLGNVSVELAPRMPSGYAELDRVLGGGLVVGSAVLIGGDPGIGKSTLLLGSLAKMSEAHDVCYVTGEESLEQVALRAKRLGVAEAAIRLMADTSLEAILQTLHDQPPKVLVIDSVQTLHTAALDSAPGSVSQVRECAAALVRFAKTKGVATVFVGHVTKEGTLAGPRVLEHMVDTVLYFESDSGSRFRIVRGVKNRFGAADEMGVFAMTEAGFREVKNPSAIFLARASDPVAGSAVVVTREGTRPLLVELQALVDESFAGHPKRLAQGLDGQRLGMLLAILHRHVGLALADRDVFANVVGGLKISETALDLPLALAVMSSFRDRIIPGDAVFFGELGLTGEVRPVTFGTERLAAAAKQGFKRAVVPMANVPTDCPLQVCGVKKLSEAVDVVFSGEF